MLNNWHFFRFEIQLREEESSYQQQRRRLYQEIEAEKERCDQQLQQMKKEYDERRAAHEESSKQTVKVAQEDNQKQLQELKEKHQVSLLWRYPVGNCMFKFNNRNTRTRYEICSKLTIKTPERRQWRRSVVFIVNFKRISHVSIVNFEQVNASWLFKIFSKKSPQPYSST